MSPLLSVSLGCVNLPSVLHIGSYAVSLWHRRLHTALVCGQSGESIRAFLYSLCLCTYMLYVTRSSDPPCDRTLDILLISRVAPWLGLVDPPGWLSESFGVGFRLSLPSQPQNPSEALYAWSSYLENIYSCRQEIPSDCQQPYLSFWTNGTLRFPQARGYVP